MGRKKKSRRPLDTPKAAPKQELADCYEGQRFDDLLMKIQRGMELAKLSKGDLSDKIWIKQQFAVGVNDVTRVLERMPPSNTVEVVPENFCSYDKSKKRATLISLQAVIVAADCKPKWLTKHIPTLAASRNIPVIFVRDNRGGSLRLGALLKLKTALAIGIKTKGNSINAAIEEIVG
ncbi:hypothetical protein HPP92_012764 [Vanilla planifolia]|uniref:Ribosomal protein eL8/eL30/eS12/Gadd45 domain-containing protein n=1 Tax=Vanilla planifolia TaxID=51239 RepID=A0A835QWT4_VANPL|nr:hypothetical protein HPP92_012764 [Vanilla planifolia]